MKNNREHKSSAAESARGVRWTCHPRKDGSLLSIPELVMAGFDHFRKASLLDEHRHDGAYEFVYVEKGQASWDIGGTVYGTRAGEVIHTRPDELHRGHLNVIEPCRIWWIIVQAPHDDFWLRLLESESRDMRTHLDKLPRIVQPGLSIVDLFRQLRAAIEGSSALRSVQIRQLLTGLLMRILQPEASNRLQDDLRERLTALTGRLADHPEWRPSVKEMAAFADVSEPHFYRIFQEYTGMTPMSYIERVRIEQSCLALSRSKEPITGLALDLGFRTSQHFATAFKRVTGMTPTAWRKRN